MNVRNLSESRGFLLHRNMGAARAAMSNTASWFVVKTHPQCWLRAQYTIDPQHTYPSFEASHMGISVWRGKFDKTSGTATFDEAAGRGEVDILVDLKSVDFGLKSLNEFMVGPEFFDVSKFPDSRYRGTLAGFVNGVPTPIEGALTLHGVTKPLTLTVNSFKCIPIRC